MPTSVFSSKESKVKGTPIWLFRLPTVALETYFWLSTIWINSLVVVFPFVPVMAIMGKSASFYDSWLAVAGLGAHFPLKNISCHLLNRNQHHPLPLRKPPGPRHSPQIRWR